MTPVKAERKINYEFKILYFWGIVFIVACHCGYGGLSLGYEWFYPGAFHLALFAFASGYFYQPKAEAAIGKFIWKKVLSLLLPMYLWNVFYGILVTILHPYGFTIGGEFNLYNLFIAPLNSGHQFGFNFPTWFVFPLFTIQVFNVLFRKLIRIFGKVNEYLIFAIYLLIGFVGAYLAAEGWHSGWYVHAVRSMYLLPFYTLGTLYKEKLEKRDNLNSILYFAILFVLQLIIIVKYKGIYYVTLVWGLGFDKGTVVTPYIVALLGIAFWLRISKLLTPMMKKSKLVMTIANNTFSIMNHHILGFFVLNTVFALVSKYTGFFNSFNWDSYYSQVQYAFQPRGLAQFKFIYLVVGLLFPLGIKFTTDFIKTKFKNRFTQLRKNQEN